jgi:hypothetical protein
MSGGLGWRGELGRGRLLGLRERPRCPGSEIEFPVEIAVSARLGTDLALRALATCAALPDFLTL